MKVETLTLNEPDIANFAKSRNVLLKKAKEEWVLFLDTDEKLSSKLKEEIKNLDPKDFDGFYIKRKIIFLGKNAGEDKVLRLARKNAGSWVRKVHEVWKVKGRVGTLENYIIHNTANNLHSYIDKMNKYSDIHAKENKREGKTSSILKIIFYPQIKFIQNIFLGRGFVFGLMQSLHSFLGWSKLWELQEKLN